MNPRELTEHLRHQGCRLKLTGDWGRIRVRVASREVLSEQVRQLIHENKEKLLLILVAEAFEKNLSGNILEPDAVPVPTVYWSTYPREKRENAFLCSLSLRNLTPKNAPSDLTYTKPH